MYRIVQAWGWLDHRATQSLLLEASRHYLRRSKPLVFGLTFRNQEGSRRPGDLRDDKTARRRPSRRLRRCLLSRRSNSDVECGQRHLIASSESLYNSGKSVAADGALEAANY